MCGCLIAQQIDQHRGKPVYRVGGQARLRLEILGRKRIERAEGQRVTVEQQEGRLFGSGLRRRRSHTPTLGNGCDRTYDPDASPDP
ncbi:Uncharacterised protein [Mycobacteroides abscessus subsp. massiliense]|nr:Uncharacterised protein [Mycobacteroides abscessus subsp. massiliense]